jgi:hypothetical protein
MIAKARLTAALFSSVMYLLATLFLASPHPARAQTVVKVEGCNSVAFQQIPGKPDLFIGRRLINTSSEPCSGDYWTLALFQMNWPANSLKYVRDIVHLPVTLAQGDVVITAYDPTLAFYNGELWVAFECAGSGPDLGGIPAGSCIAPLSANHSIITSRISLPVAGVRLTATVDGYSASVPKIFVFDGRPYLYWSALHFINGPKGQLAQEAVTRGAELMQGNGAQHRLWVRGSPGSAIPSTRGVEVFGLDPARGVSSGTADSFDAQVFGSRILLMAGAGGRGCSAPLDPSYGCYHLEIRSATEPLALRGFNHSFVSSPAFPFNPQEYSKIVTDPNGNKFIMGAYFAPRVNRGSQSDNLTKVTGFIRYPVDLGTFRFSAGR